MKNIFAVLVLAAALAGVSFAQAPAKGQGVKTAVVEFTPGPNASTMNDQAKRGLQTMLSARLNHTRKFNVYDTRHTRNASQADLAAINGASTAAAVKLGKQLGVAYVVTGTVSEYAQKAADGHGHATVSVRMVEVATGKVKYSGEVSVRSGKPMNAGTQPEMQAQVMRHIVDQFVDLLEGRF
ncbi:MAG TPA: CsgG/HfaB family protein [Pyrinomonadaceae bacterium]|nr:CsgG/HfaB family protein [Pyrinomonadaceae bacterium]HMP65944.1 CsgG/HfaB family protein [Pyrinomonadaceae bacterium]